MPAGTLTKDGRTGTESNNTGRNDGRGVGADVNRGAQQRAAFTPTDSNALEHIGGVRGEATVNELRRETRTELLA